MLESLNAYSFILVAVNLLILYIVLKKILFKPVTAFMEKRTQAIENSITDAEKQKAEAAALKASYEQLLKESKVQGEQIVAEAAARAGAKSDQILAKAKADADLLLQNARAEINREREKMLQEIHNQVVDLAIEAAGKVVEANMDTSRNIQIVENFLEEEGAA